MYDHLPFLSQNQFRASWWLGTWNNPPQDDDPVKLCQRNSAKIVYCSGQKEVGETGKVRYHFILRLRSDQRPSYMGHIHLFIQWTKINVSKKEPHVGRCYLYVHKKEGRLQKFPDFGIQPERLYRDLTKLHIKKRKFLPKS
jgi:hypothetical protein